MPVGLSPSEWRIMQLLWEKPMTMPQLLGELSPFTGWSKHTIISFLNRMLKKGVVEAIDGKPARLYRPLIPREASVEEETRDFVQRIFSGNAGLLVASLVEQEALSEEEMQALARLLSDAQKKKGVRT